MIPPGSVVHGRIIRPAFLPRFFPRDYVRSVLAPDYWPDLQIFADDYLRRNPTRNRAVDLLPLLLHFDEERVRKALPFEKIGARPALHYRLPRAHVGRPGWSVIPDWERWQSVPDLAGDTNRLQALSASYLRFEGTEDAWARATGLNHAAAF